MDICGNIRNKFISKIALNLVCPGFILLFVFGCFSCGRNKEIKNIILITLDTHRADHISAIGSPFARTPNIDFFAESGIIFQNCYSPIPITLPAHYSLFYSQPPHMLKVYNNGQVMPEKIQAPSLASLFARKGYDTAAFVSLGVLKSQFKLNEGFNLYDDSFPETRWYLNAAEINEKVISWLNQQHQNPFFLWIHYSDPHDPYAPPSLPPDFRINLNGQFYSEFCLQKKEIIQCEFELIPGENIIDLESLKEFPVPRDDFRISLNDFEHEEPDYLKFNYENLTFYHRGDKQSVFIKQRGRIKIFNSGNKVKWTLRFQGNINLFPTEMRNAYKNEVEYLDSEIGKLTGHLRKLGLLENSIIVLVGDHGEGLGDHYSELGESYFGHIHYLYTCHTRIPSIIYDASLKTKSLKIKKPISLMDLAPTMLKLTGLPIPRSYIGKNRLNVDDSVQTDDYIFFETYTPEAIADRFALLRYPWLIIYAPEKIVYELYDLQDDPLQNKNIYLSHKDQPFIQELKHEIDNRARNILSAKKEVKLDRKSQEMLKSLGYIK